MAVIKIGGATRENATERFQADTENEIASFGTDYLIGSTILALDTGNVWKLNSNREWKMLP